MTEPRYPWPSITGPSIFMEGRVHRPLRNGKSAGQVASEVVARRTAKTGRNPGTVAGLSRAEKRANKSTNAYLHKSGAK